MPLKTEKFRIYSGMVDSHFHILHIMKQDPAALDFLQYCFSNGMAAALDIGIKAENFGERNLLAENFNGLYLAHGYYPSEAGLGKPTADIAFLEKNLTSSRKVVAIGEIGLDYYHKPFDARAQKALFIEQLKLADRLSLPVVIHSRDALDDTLSVLKSCAPGRGGVIHCYSYDKKAAERFIEMGFLISFAGNVTYKNADQIRETAACIPLEMLLVETDAPYLSPVPLRGKTNHPGHTGYTCEFVAALRNMPVEELVSATADNFRRLFLSGLNSQE